MPKTRFIQLQQFKEYAYDTKLNKPQHDRPVYTDLYLPKGMDVIITESGKKGHSIITTAVGTHFYEVKGSPEAIKNLIDKEEQADEPKGQPDPLPKPVKK